MSRQTRTDLERREFLRIGLTGFSSLTLSQLLQLRSGAAEARKEPIPERTAIILVWLLAARVISKPLIVNRWRPRIFAGRISRSIRTYRGFKSANYCRD